MKSLNTPKMLVKPIKAMLFRTSFWGSVRTGGILAFGCFVISGANLFGQALPLSACVVAALPMGLQAVLAAMGAVFGYFLRCEAAAAAEYAALTLLMLSAVAVFQGTRLPTMRWFMPSMAACVSAVLGGISVLGGAVQVSLLMTKVLLAFVCTEAFAKAFSANRHAMWAFAAALVLGLSAFSLKFDLGILAACMLSAASGQLPIAAMLGLLLDLSGGYGQCAVPALILPALLCRSLSAKDKTLSAATFIIMPNLVFFCFGQLNLGLFAANITGAMLGIGFRRAMPSLFVTSATDRTDERLHEAAKLMEMLSGYLPSEVNTVSQSEAEEVYDAAAERVCRCCPRFHRCWEQGAEQTFAALSSAAYPIIDRGVAQAEDFLPSFRENCCHLEGFIVALNQELEGMLFRRRYRMQLRESRQVLSQELKCVAQYLKEVQMQPKVREKATFMAQVGISAVNKKGERISGDCGAYFAGANSDFYVLLCDGMGSGESAALGSHETVRLLQRLLKSGLSAESALKILNGTQILRQAHSYTTVDLLCIDLNSANATLYKWGAAPSFLRHFDSIKKMGTATTPPGVSIHYEPERYTFSLKHEELLVLASDGADAEQIESGLSAYRGNSPRELTALLAATAKGEDDMTTVAISLRLRT